jgi:hypothetical protein
LALPLTRTSRLTLLPLGSGPDPSVAAMPLLSRELLIETAEQGPIVVRPLTVALTRQAEPADRLRPPG